MPNLKKSSVSLGLLLVSALLILCREDHPGSRRAAPEVRLSEPSSYVVSCSTKPTRPSSLEILTSARPQSGELAFAETQSYEVHLKAGQLANVIVDQKQTDVVVCLYDQEGKILLSVDRPTGGEQPEVLAWTNKESGTFRLEIRRLGQGPAARYIATLTTDSRPDAKELAGQRASTLTNVAEELRRNHDPKAWRLAQKNYLEALSFWEIASDYRSKGDTLYRLGELERRRLRQERAAIRHLGESLPLLREAHLPFTEAQARMALGSSLLSIGEASDSSTHFVHAAALFRELEDLNREATARNELAYSYQLQGRNQEALVTFGQAIDCWRLARQPGEEATSRHNRGVLYWTIGKTTEARLDLFAALRIRERFAQTGEARELHVATLNVIGGTYYSDGNFSDALHYLQQVLSVRREIGDRRGEAVTLGTIGLILERLHRFREAVSFQQQSVRLFAASGNKLEQAKAYHRLGLCLTSDGRTKEAAAALESAITGARRFGDLQLEAAASYGLAKLARNEGDLETSWTLVQRTLESIEKLRTGVSTFDLRVDLQVSYQAYYDFAVSLLVEIGQRAPQSQAYQLALEVADKARARGLVDLIKESGAQGHQNVPPLLLARRKEVWTAIRNRHQLIDNQNPELVIQGSEREDTLLRSLEKELLEIDATIENSRHSSKGLVQPETLQVRNLQARIMDQNSLLLFYKLAEPRSFLWVVGQTSLEVFPLSSRQHLEKLARQVHRGLSAPVGNSLQVQVDLTLAKLADELLGPVIPRSSGKRLVIVADGALQLVPFSALPVLGERAPSEGTIPLVVLNEIVMVPSLSTLVALHDRQAVRPRTPRSLALVADPVFSIDDTRVLGRSRTRSGVLNSKLGLPKRYVRLPFSRLEAHLAAEEAQEIPVLHLLDFSANRRSILDGRLSKYSIIHFATHAELSPGNPALGKLVLSLVDERGNPLDGNLYSGEIFGLKLPTELVVLSACDSGLGDDIRGEGMIGLPYAFLNAGAQAVLGSLWQVDDRAGASLMRDFYHYLFRRGKGPAAALRHAQINQWQKHVRPRFWAGFELQGLSH